MNWVLIECKFVTDWSFKMIYYSLDFTLTRFSKVLKSLFPLLDQRMLKICQLSKIAWAVSCFFVCWLCCRSKPGLSEKEPLISLNNSHACVDLIPLASATPLMVSLSLTGHCIKAHSAFESQHLSFLLQPPSYPHPPFPRPMHPSSRWPPQTFSFILSLHPLSFEQVARIMMNQTLLCCRQFFPCNKKTNHLWICVDGNAFFPFLSSNWP